MERELLTTRERAESAAPQLRDEFTTILGVRLRYWRAGERGAPLLLMHGLNGCVENWRWNIGPLAQQHRVFAFDGPGHGLSQADERVTDLDFMRDVVLQFMREQQLERAHLVALSGGGLVALKLALEQPAAVQTLTLVDAAGLGRGIHPRMRIVSMLPSPPPIALARRLRREDLQFWLVRAFFQDPRALTEPMLDDFYTNICRDNTMRTASLMMRWGVNLLGQKYVFAHRLRHIKSPTLIIWGKQDKLIPVRHAYRALRRIPSARLVVFDGCGHLPMLERAREFNRELLDFLAAEA